ncbi:MAG: endonuclease [Bacilli bacterium]
MYKKSYLIIVSLFFFFMTFTLVGCKPNIDEDAIAKIEEVYSNLFSDQDLKNVTNDLYLPTYVDEVLISWTSDKPEVMANDGTISSVETEKMLILTAKMTHNGTSIEKYFGIIVKPNNDDPLPLSPYELVSQVSSNLLSSYNLQELYYNINLPTSISNVSITWESNNQSVISNQGVINQGIEDKEATLTAILSYMNYQKTMIFNVIVKNMVTEFDSYYQGVEGLFGETLKDFLHDLIDDHQEYSYDFARTALRETDEDPNNPNNVILFYTGRSQLKTTYNTGNDGWNREHVWAKSHGGFGETPPAGTDLHHLRPTDATVNSTRNNLDFDNGGKLLNETYGMDSSFCYYDTDSFEPRDQVKGDVARILFYMAVRYDGSDGVADLEINDVTGNGSIPFIGKLSTLLIWNDLDPVDDFEKNRNEVIFGYQKNRNPFIDYPHFADLIWEVTTTLNFYQQISNEIKVKIIVINLEVFKKQIFS